jgi:hypothetical protein
MNRRGLFKFLGAAPAVLVSMPTSEQPPEPKKQDRMWLPADMKPGETLTILNLGPDQIAVLK